MKKLFGALVLACVMATGSAHAQFVIKPGQWYVTGTISMSAFGLPLPSTTIPRTGFCVDTSKTNEAPLPVDSESQCVVSNPRIGTNSFSGTVTCNGTLKGTGSYTATLLSSERFTTAFNFQGTVTGAPGTVTVNYNMDQTYDNPVCTSGTTPTTPTQPATVTPETGLYYNSSQPGRGFSLEVNSANRMFFASYGYEEGGRSIWLVATLTRQTGTNTFSGDMLQVTGGQVLGGAAKTPVVSNRGAMTVAATSTSGVLVTWPASFGAAPPVTLTRYPVNGTAVVSPAANLPAATGWWYNPNQPGRGFFLDIQGTNLFLATYMYRTDGSAVWYVASGAMTGSSYTGTLAEYTGGPSFLNPGRTTVAAVPLANNAVSLQISSASAATITIGGSQVSLIRYSF